MKIQKKQGTAFECVVKEIAQIINPSSIVEQGKWLDSPDGQRDCDVYIKNSLKGLSNKILIECKDYKRPVGVGFVDALDSKRQDLDIDAVFICSNSGFTKYAVNKAERKGIGLIAVMKSHDNRIRYKLLENIYIRHVKPVTVIMTLDIVNGAQLKDLKALESTYRGLPLLNWVYKQVQLIILHNPIVKGVFQCTQKMLNPITIQTNLGDLELLGLTFKASFTGCWLKQTSELDSTGAIYNWLNKRITIPPFGQTTFTLKDLNLYEGTIVKSAPPSVLALHGYNRKGFSLGEASSCLIITKKIVDEHNVPDLADLIHKDDLDLKLNGLTAEHLTSDMSYEIDIPK